MSAAAEVPPSDNVVGKRAVLRFVDVPIDKASRAVYGDAPEDKLTEPARFLRAHAYTTRNKLTAGTPLDRDRSMARLTFECDPAAPRTTVEVIVLGADTAIPRVGGARAWEPLDVVDHPVNHRPVGLLRVLPRGTTAHRDDCEDPACLACGETS